MTLCNYLSGFTNVAMLGLSILSIFIYANLSNSAHPCLKMGMADFLLAAVFLMTVALIGIIGVCCKSKAALILYLFMLSAGILGLVGEATYSYIVITDSARSKVGQLQFGQFSQSLQRNVEQDWMKKKECMRQAQICQNGPTADAPDAAAEENIKAFQEACCRPPPGCGFVFINNSTWVPPPILNAKDPDCNAWNSGGYCYECSACMAYFGRNLKRLWLFEATNSSIILVVVIFALIVGCYVWKGEFSNEDKNRAS